MAAEMRITGTVLMVALVTMVSGCSRRQFFVTPGRLLTVGRVSQPLTLKCTSTISFEWCTFRHQARQCDVSWRQLSGLQIRECAHFADRVRLTGVYARNECEITLDEALPADDGMWECEMEEWSPMRGRGVAKAVRRSFEIRINQTSVPKHTKRMAGEASPVDDENIETTTTQSNTPLMNVLLNLIAMSTAVNNDTVYQQDNGTNGTKPTMGGGVMSSEEDKVVGLQPDINATPSGPARPGTESVDSSGQTGGWSLQWVLMIVIAVAVATTMMLGAGWWCKTNATLIIGGTGVFEQGLSLGRGAEHPATPPSSPVVPILPLRRIQPEDFHCGTIRRQH